MKKEQFQKRKAFDMLEENIEKNRNQLLKAYKRVGDAIHEWLDMIDLLGYVDSEDKLFDLIKRSEQFTNEVRTLPARTFVSEPTESLTDVFKDVHGYSLKPIGESEEMGYNLTIPHLLPKKEKGDARFIRGSLQYFLEDYYYKNGINQIEEPSTIVFVHEYGEEIPTIQWRDHDNIELNVVVDQISHYMLLDDSPDLCRHLYLSKEAEKTQTEVYIIRNKFLLNWLKEKELYL